MADVETIFAELKGLRVHANPRAMTEAQETQWMKDFSDELIGFHGRAVREGFRKWKLGDDRRLPTVGQIVALVRHEQARIGRPEPEAGVIRSEPWTPGCIGEGEYADMSLRDKAREQRLWANHLELGASRLRDMSRPESEQSEAYAFQRRRAASCREEAARLAGLMTHTPF